MRKKLDVEAAAALHEIDQIIGNQKTVSAEELGQVRGIVLTTLNNWHRKHGNPGCHPRLNVDDDISVMR